MSAVTEWHVAASSTHTKPHRSRFLADELERPILKLSFFKLGVQFLMSTITERLLASLATSTPGIALAFLYFDADRRKTGRFANLTLAIYIFYLSEKSTY